MDNIDLSSVPAKALNYTSRLLLGKFLNPEQNLLSGDGFARDYRGLAEQMNFQYDDIRIFQRNEEPTMKILESWTTHSDATIGKLVGFLENMGRHDVIQDLQPRFVNDSKIYLQEIEKYQDSPLQVPEVTSCRTQYSQLDDLNILTRDDANTGECTLYDAYVSYADEDYLLVLGLVHRLETSGFKLFIRSRDLLAGHSEYETNMQLIKDRCKRVLIVLTPDFLKCPACEVQASFAAGLGFDERCRKIIPILLRPCEIPLILKYVSKIDFTKPDVQDWIWEKLKLSLRDVPASIFISVERRSAQINGSLPQIETSIPDSNNPIVCFPPTTSYALSSRSIVNNCASSADAFTDMVLNDSALSLKETSSPPKRKNKLRFWQTKKESKKGDGFSSNYSSLTSVSSSSNATSGFHSQSGNALESIEVSAEALLQNTQM